MYYQYNTINFSLLNVQNTARTAQMHRGVPSSEGKIQLYVYLYRDPLRGNSFCGVFSYFVEGCGCRYGSIQVEEKVWEIIRMYLLLL